MVLPGAKPTATGAELHEVTAAANAGE